MTPPPASTTGSDATASAGSDEPAAALAAEAVTRLAASQVPPAVPDAETRATSTDVDGLDETRAVSVPASTPRAAPHGSPAGRTGPLAVGQGFSARYHIIRVLGIGGMGAVYHAWDADLGIAVALKVIRPEATAEPAMAREMERRFKQELVLARQVTHKNVVRIHDLGEIDGIKYITMPYLEGEDLATLLRRSGKLAVAPALRIVRDVAAGLAAAHEAGIVHRDLKPANIMVLKDRAVIMDFGIARSSSGSSEARVPAAPADVAQPLHVPAAATVVGTILGTVQYMAPEQAKGQPVDQRADIYALGLIFLDILLGGRQGSSADESALDELKRRIEKAPPPARASDPTIPPSIEQFIARCLEPDPAARFQTSAEVVEALGQLDDNGQPIPVRRVVGMKLMAAVIVLLLGIAAGAVWYQRQFIPPPERAPVSVVIADVENGTADPAFDRTLEPMLRRALEGAGFVTAYDRSRVRALGVEQPDRLDTVAARQLAVKQGLGVVLASSIVPLGGGYRISIRATQAVSDNELVAAEGRASNREDVLEVAARLIGRVRNALGDDMPESDQQFAMGSLSATSLDVVRLYAAGLEASSKTRFEEARQHALKAVELDPNFGIGYLLAAASSRNLGRLEDDQKYLNEALRHLDGMTERERYATRGYSYWTTGDYQQCVKEYGELVSKYPSDIGGRNQLALCQSHLRQLRSAMQEMQQVVSILPSHPLFRHNLALYANYASDFETGEREARAVEGPDLNAVLAIAFAQLGRGRLADARGTYESLRQMGARGASLAAAGLGDLAILEGRFTDAVGLLRKGAADDLMAGNTGAAAAKFAAAAHAEVSRGRSRAAIEAAEEALRYSDRVNIRFLAARTFVEAGNAAGARSLIDGLAKELYPEPQAHAKILEGMLAVKDGDPRRAMNVLREANALFDTWIGHFELGRASLEAGAYPQADSEFDVCLNARRGEALSLFVDEQPTYAYLAPVYYYMGRVRQALNSNRFGESYAAYLDLRGQSTEDPLLPDVRRLASPREPVRTP